LRYARVFVKKLGKTANSAILAYAWQEGAFGTRFVEDIVLNYI